MVSSFAQASLPRSLRFSLCFVENRPRAGRTGSVLLLGGSRLRENGGAMKEQEEEERKREGGTKGGFRSWSSADAVSILFVHANYSSSVTLLEIEGTGTPRPFPRSRRHRHRRRCRHLFLLHPLFLSCQPSLLFPSFPRAHHRGSLFSFLPARSSLPCPGGFLMDPDYVAFYLPSFYSPLPTTRSTAALLLFSRCAHERSLYRFQKTLRRILISRQLSRARARLADHRRRRRRSRGNSSAGFQDVNFYVSRRCPSMKFHRGTNF